MTNTNNDNVNSQNEFFGNNDVPYCLKAGAAAVLLHATVDYYKNPENQNSFMALFFEKDTSKTGKPSRAISGSMSFTFGVPASMAKDNCQASLRKLKDLYPTVGDILDNIADNSQQINDELICDKLANASAQRFRFSPEGTIEHWDKYISDNYDIYAKFIQENYPGMVSAAAFNSVKTKFENACKKKTLAQAKMLQ